MHPLKSAVPNSANMAWVTCGSGQVDKDNPSEPLTSTWPPAGLGKSLVDRTSDSLTLAWQWRQLDLHEQQAIID